MASYFGYAASSIPEGETIQDWATNFKNKVAANTIVTNPQLKEAMLNPSYNQVQAAKKANPGEYVLGNALADLMALWSGEQSAGAEAPSLVKSLREGYNGNNSYPKVAGESLNPNEIRFSQGSVNGADEITASMKANGWLGEPVDVVKMPDGKLTSVDNTRIVSARQAGIDVKANVHGYDDPLAPDQMSRFATRKGIPTTWGEAVRLRIGKQNSAFRNNFPFGSLDLPTLK